MAVRKSVQSKEPVKQWKVIQAQVQSLAKKAEQVRQEKGEKRP